MSLVVIGGTVVDVIFHGVKRLPAWPEHTEFTASNLVRPSRVPLVTLGGNGANAAYIAAVCGARVTLHTALAADALGGLARGWLESIGCRIRTANRSEATAVNVTAADAQHRRATLFYPGAPVGLPRLLSTSREVRAVLVCGWPHPPLPAIARGFSALRVRGVLTAFDPGLLLGRPWPLAALSPVLRHLELLLVNDHELRALARATDLATALRRFRAQYAGHIVVKRGNNGALWLPAGAREPQKFCGRAVRVVNTVGAGDAFNGALAVALAEGLSFAEAIRWGLAAGALAVTKAGAQPSMPTRAEVMGMVRRGVVA
jgi:ribokinase